MTLASLGWVTWWIVAFVHKLGPGLEIKLLLPSVLSTAFASLGLMQALLTIRAGRSWLAFAAVPLLANASLLLVPWLAWEMAKRAAQ